MSSGFAMAYFGSESFALVDSELIVNVVGRTMGGRGEREIGSRALLAGRTGGCLAGRPMNRARTPRLGRRKAKRKWGPNLYRRVNKSMESELLVLNEYDGIENRFRRSGSR